MRDAGKEKREEVRDEATDSRTLDEIEENEKVSSNEESTMPMPDEGSGRDADDNDDQPFD
jgi:hypothetical protein